MSGKILQFKQKSKEPEVNPVDQIIDEMGMLLCVLEDEEIVLQMDQDGEEIVFTPTAHVVVLSNGEGQLIIQHSAKDKHVLEEILMQVLGSLQEEQEEDDLDG